MTNGYVEDVDPFPNGLGGGILVVDGSSPTFQGVVLRDNTAMAGTLIPGSGDLFGHRDFEVAGKKIARVRHRLRRGRA